MRISWSILALCLSCLPALSDASATENPTAILFIGDSVTIGVEANGNFPQYISIPWAELTNAGFLGTSTTDLNPLEQLGSWPLTHPAKGSYWSYVAQRLDSDLPDILHLMFGVNDSEGVHEKCTRVTSAVPSCPLKPAEYRGNLEITIEEINEFYLVRGQRKPLILVSSPTFAPRSFLGALGPEKRTRLEGYEEQVYRLVKGKSNVCFGINGREVLFSPYHFRYLDWHPTIAGHKLLASALQERIESLDPERWATTTVPQWQAYLNYSWIEEQKPDWFSYDVWYETRSSEAKSHSRWRNHRNRWSKLNKYLHHAEWRRDKKSGTAPTRAKA